MATAGCTDNKTRPTPVDQWPSSGTLNQLFYTTTLACLSQGFLIVFLFFFYVFSSRTLPLCRDLTESVFFNNISLLETQTVKFIRLK